MSNSTDRTFLERLQTGDERALVDLADAYRSKVYQLAFRYLRNKEDAEEVTQDVLYNVYRSAGSFRGDAALWSWIYRITFNASISRVRTAPRRWAADNKDGEELADVERGIADWRNMADDRVVHSQFRRRVFRAILGLPAMYRAPVILRDIQGMSTDEASAMLRVKTQTLKSRLHRGRLILRKQLADFAGGLTLHRPIYRTPEVHGLAARS